MSTLPAIYDQIDKRTLEILERRRSSPRVERRGWLVRRALFVADVCGLTAAFLVSEQLFGGGISANGHLGTPGEYLLFVCSLPAWAVAAKLYGLYDKDEERTDHSTTQDFTGVFHLITVVTWLIFVVSRFTPVHPELKKLLVFWACAVLSVPLARTAGRAFCRRQIQYLQNTVIVGAGEVGQSLARKLLRHPEYGLNLVGFVDRDPIEPAHDLVHVAMLGGSDELIDLVGLLDIERVIFAFSTGGHRESVYLIRMLNDLNVQVDVVPRFFEVIGGGVDVHTVEGVPVIGLPPFKLSRSSALMKRSLDVLGALVGLVLLSPLFAMLALLIKLDSRGPIFFRQVRAGSGHSVFRIWKLRTMTADADENKAELAHLNKHRAPGGDPRMFKIDNDPRVTRVGAYLRRLSLDELPQLINVLRGEMSLVGPRPLILEEHEHIREWAERRLALKPGITGLWQVLGRDEIGFEEMTRLDYLYVTSWSIGRDVSLVLRTLPRILFSKSS
jgi:exopolysaccharide biosynthesis polyprenyl glycosylphosphotransferase